jgi:hypothetical protein
MQDFHLHIQDQKPASSIDAINLYQQEPIITRFLSTAKAAFISVNVKVNAMDIIQTVFALSVVSMLASAQVALAQETDQHQSKIELSKQAQYPVQNRSTVTASVIPRMSQDASSLDRMHASISIKPSRVISIEPKSASLPSGDMMMSGGFIPPGIMVGRAGEWMLGYQYMFDNMAGNLVGTSPISSEQILKRFAATPTSMTMQMHMFMAMYAPRDDLTLMVMLPYIRKSMNHVTGMGAPFIERTDGISDVELRGLYTLYVSGNLEHRILLNAGVGLPTGSINKSMGGMRLEYPMQLGSGTFSLLPGLIYLGTAMPWSWGAEFASNMRFGQNSNDYRLGNRYRLSTWGARQLTNLLTVSIRADSEQWDNIHGADPQLDPTDEPTKDPKLQGGKRLDILFGISLYPTEGIFKKQQFFIEAGAPVYQSLDGPQLKRSWVARATWQWPF